MNLKRFSIAAILVYVVYQILSFVIHEVILVATYQSLADVWRPEADMHSKQWIFFLTGAIWALFFTCIYTKGYEGKGVMEGVRYGLWIGLFISIPRAYEEYVVYSIPYSLALKWFIYGTLQAMICGAVLALSYKPEQAASSE